MSIAVTYRYIIRTDQNSHLKDGAVLAFGLVRGLAISENINYLHKFNESFLLFGLLVAESIFCFIIARLCLDLSLQQGWIEPFNNDE